MKLRITEEMWGINHRTGESSVRKTDKKKLDCAANAAVTFEKGHRSFFIGEVTENSVSVTIRCANERYNKTWTLEKGKTVFYRPRSMDGGYQYRIRAM